MEGDLLIAPSRITAAIAKLKAGFSGYLENVKAEEKIVVTDRGRPLALTIPINEACPRTSAGRTWPHKG